MFHLNWKTPETTISEHSEIQFRMILDLFHGLLRTFFPTGIKAFNSTSSTITLYASSEPIFFFFFQLLTSLVSLCPTTKQTQQLGKTNV